MNRKLRASLFVTCLVDQFHPRVGLASARLLRKLGVGVTFNPDQTCCGQPAFNSGFQNEAREVALHALDVFEKELRSSDHIVVPSGSCASMVKNHYAELFEDDDDNLARAREVAARTHELSEFIVKVLGVEDVGATLGARVTYHDSCHLLRELGVSDEPRKLIRGMSAVEFVEMPSADACCGFGGAFSVRYPEISSEIGAEKAAAIERSGADVVVACDSGCLMQISSLLARRNSRVRCIHLSEALTCEEEY